MKRAAWASLPLILGLGGGLQGAAPSAEEGPQKNPHGTLETDCGECHGPNRWVPVLPRPRFVHDKTGFPLQGAHAQASCRSCHRSLVFNHVATSCADCHKDPHNHELGTQCETCHGPRTWTNQREVFRTHNRTRFPLFAVHANVDCASCHRNQRPNEYVNTPTTCGACHLQDYLKAQNPNHAQSSFPTRCEDCHSMRALGWKTTRFSDHSRTRFPLTGAHQGVDCARCHVGGRYAGTPTDCQSCHRDRFQATTSPNHAAAGFPTQCEACHSTSGWRPASFDHNQSRFPLTGAHTRVECSRCHAGGRFAGTPTACYSCHQAAYNGTSNPSHAAAAFPTSCESCHTTSAWRPATFDHDGRYFPIYSGQHRGRWAVCRDCHQTANYRAFECILCHEHSNRSEVDREHREVNGYSYASAACYRCHPRGSQ